MDSITTYYIDMEMLRYMSNASRLTHPATMKLSSFAREKQTTISQVQKQEMNISQALLNGVCMGGLISRWKTLVKKCQK